MNIFYLDSDPQLCAQMHVDKHCVKMIIEYAQLMSTAHRLLDGTPYIDKTANGRSIKRWRLDDINESVMMKASHINHPSAVWTRSNRQNYVWLYKLWYYLCEEYTHRYDKVHAVKTRLHEALYLPPNNISNSAFYPPTPAMPDEFKVVDDEIQSYKNYYLGAKSRMFSWKKRSIPDFVINNQC